MAYSSIGALIADIKQEISEIGNKIARGVAQVASSELRDAHTEIMNSFYSGYTPVGSYTYYYYSPGGIFYSGRSHGYRRTGNLRNSLVSNGVIGSGHSFAAKIQIGSSGMSDYINATNHSFPGSAVFDMIWNQGIRGLPADYRGHVGDVSINAAPAGIGISGKPD